MKKHINFVKTISLLLTLLLLVSLVPITGLTAYADGEKNIACLGTASINNPTNSDYPGDSWQGDFVYYGGNKYRVLSNHGTTMLLDCDSVIRNMAFDSSGSNEWENSTVKAWLNSDANDGFLSTLTEAEQNAIDGTKEAGARYYDSGDYYPGVELKGEKVFLLEASEAVNPGYGYENPLARIKGEGGSIWWLRSPKLGESNVAGNVLHGAIESSYVKIDSVGVSPAFNLNLSSVLFSSLISQNPNVYKLTLNDSSLRISVPEGALVKKNESVITIPYDISGVNATENTKVFVLITDSGGSEVKQYTELTEGSVKGTGVFTMDSSITGAWRTDYIVYILAVNEETEYYSDSASNLCSVPAPSHEHSFTYSLSTDKSTITAECKGTVGTCNITDGLSLTLSAPQDLTYDGNAKAATLNNDYNTTAFPGTYAITYYKDGQIVNAVKDAEDYTAKVTAGTGEGAVTASVDFTISPKSITGAKVVLENDTLEYTSSQQSVSVKSVTLADGTSLAADDYEVSGNTGTDAGPYTLKVTGKGNYTGTATAGWRIGTTSMVVAADDVTAVYDAQSHGITVNVTKPENGAAVKYGTEEGTYDLDESPAITNVSESPSTVYFKVTADNYDDYTGSATVTISPKSIAGATVTLDSTSLEYTGTEQSVSVKSVTLADGTELTAADYDISGNTGTDAGSYTLTVTGKGNYTGTAEAGWTIEEEPEEDTSEPEEEPEEPTEPATEPEEEEPTEPDGEEPTELEEPTDPENPTEPEEPTEPAEDDPVIDPPAPDYHIVFSYPWKTDGGWELYPSGWYYYDVYGRPVTGWLRDGGYWYFLDDTGLMQTGWVYDNWNWYYLYPSGAMATGWVLDGNYWYYLSPYTGAMQTGWLLENGIWYYLNPSGAMVTGDCLVDGIWYSFGADGAWIG